MDVAMAGPAKLISLSAPDMGTTNTIDQPTRVIPVGRTIHVGGTPLRHTMPGYSIQANATSLR